MVLSPSGRDVQLTEREGIALLFSCCCNTLPQTQRFRNNTDSLSYNFVDQKSHVGATGYNDSMELYSFMKISMPFAASQGFLYSLAHGSLPPSLKPAWQTESLSCCQLSGSLWLGRTLCLEDSGDLDWTPLDKPE